VVYVLDTDTCIYAIKQRSESVVARLRTTAGDDLAVSSATVAELRYGAIRSAKPRENAERLERFLLPLRKLAFDDRAAGHFAVLKHHLTRTGQPIGAMDMVIAATVLAADATLVTNNIREFGRVPGLKIENWTQPGT
jgi:tRNA(fMet)-specific endonuclease VapC